MYTPYSDIDGNTQQIYMQSKAASCGPACVATIAKMVGRTVGDEWVGALIDKRVPTISSSSGTGHDWDTNGTFSVQDALRKIGMINTHTDKTGNFERAFRRCSKTRPGMSFIRFWQIDAQGEWFTDWNMGFMHWVVILGPATSDKTRYIVLDPATGGTTQSFAELPYYSNPGHRDGLFSYTENHGVVTTV